MIFVYALIAMFAMGGSINPSDLNNIYLANTKKSERIGSKNFLNFNDEGKLNYLFGTSLKYVRPHLEEMDNANVSHVCKYNSKYFREALHKEEQWALSMLDANSKIPSGIKQGNFIWYGSFDECIRIEVNNLKENESFRGQYCMASFDFKDPAASPFGAILKEYEYQLFTSPISLGVCLPSSCSATDLKNYFVYIISESKLNITADVLDKYCQTKTITRFNASAIFVLFLLVVFFMLVLTATSIEGYLAYTKNQLRQNMLSDSIANSTTYLNPRGLNPNNGHQESAASETLLSFSLITNLKSFFNMTQPRGSIKCLHGLRVISMLWIVLLHTYSTTIASSWRNIKDLYALKRIWIAEIILNGTMAVDTFFFLGGLLVCYVTVKKLQKTNRFGLFHFYVHRYWRLTPVYAIVIGFCAAIFPFLGSGPHWPDVLDQARYCQQSWWANLLYVSNIVNTNKMCQPHCWFLAADMQLYILSPLMIYPLFRWPKVGTTITIFFIVLSIIIDSLLTYFYQLPPNAIVLAEENFFSTIIYSKILYMLPYMRFGPYCTGILLGYGLASDCIKFKIKKIFVCLGWICALSGGMAIVCGLYRHVGYNTTLSSAEAATYSALSHLCWGLCLAWVVIACVSGYGGFINNFLSLDLFFSWGKLTYCGYIIHYNLLMLYVGTRKDSIDFDNWTAMYIFLGTVIFANAVALPMYLTFELPLIKIERLLLSWYEQKMQQQGKDSTTL